ncbi:MAG: class I SAM-dependent methyltransferase [Rhodospirillaceae bacterium]
MSDPGFKVDDTAKGIGLALDAENGEITLRYSPPHEAFHFSATLRPSEDLRRTLSLLSAGIAMPVAARPPAMATRLSQLPARAGGASQTVGRRIQNLLEWLLHSKENTNYTYDLTPLNLGHLATMVSVVTGRPCGEIETYLGEPGSDAALEGHYASGIAALPPAQSALADPLPKWSRRLGWYAVVRAMKPRLVVETGVDKGLGALLLCAALRRNAAEGRAGRYIGTDKNPAAGYLLSGPYAEHGHVMIGDSIASLRTLAQPIDVFINDSDHSADYEYAEYQTIAPRLHGRSVLLGDNSHASDRLMRFAAETGRQFLFYREEPDGHWYPGAGIGFAFTSPAAPP